MKNNIKNNIKYLLNNINKFDITDRIKISKNFYLDEFIDIRMYINNKYRGLEFIDTNLFFIAQELRNEYKKPLYINTWWEYFVDKECDKNYIDIIKKVEEGLSYNRVDIRRWSGTRNEYSIGSKISAHRKFKAIDTKGNQIELFNIINNNRKKYYNLGVRRIEDINITKGWMHTDTLERNTKPNTIRIIDLKGTVKFLKI